MGLIVCGMAPPKNILCSVGLVAPWNRRDLSFDTNIHIEQHMHALGRRSKQNGVIPFTVAKLVDSCLI